MLRLTALCLAILVGWPMGASAQEGVGESRTTVDSAPLVVLHGPFEATRNLAAAMAAIARREGSGFVDLSPKPAAPPIAPSELRHAVAAYQEFDYGRAMKHLSAAMEEIRASGVRGLSNSELCDLFIYRALVRSAQGDSSAAWDDFVQAALVDPTRHLDAVRFSPSVAASFERARTKVGQSKPVTLKVQVPDRCTSSVDAHERGVAAGLVLRPGSHFLRVECEGYLPYTEVLLIDGDRTLIPFLDPIEAPSREELLAMASERGFRHLVFARVGLKGPADTVLFELSNTQGKELGRTSMHMQASSEDRPLAMAALSRLLDRLAPVVPEPIEVTKERSWYQSPWLWAAAGVVVTSALLLPFALQDQQSSGFKIELGGDTP